MGMITVTSISGVGTIDLTTLVYTLLALPTIAAAISILPNPRAREVASLISSATCLALSIAMFHSVLTCTLQSGWIYVDLPAAVIVFLIQAIYFLSVLYSIHFVNEIWKERPLFLRRRHYYALINLFAMSMTFAAVSRNLGLMWVGLEATTIVSALLIVLERSKASVEAAWRYIIVASAGLGVALLSLVMFHAFSGTVDWTRAEMSAKAATLVAVLAFVGFGTKVGIFPMHTWLPDAHGTAPPAVSAMLSATLLPVALLAYLRVFEVAVAAGALKVVYITCFAGAVTALVAAILAVPQRIVKRLFAYSSMDVMGIAMTGVGLSAISPVALKATLLLLIIHAFSKSALFFTGGNVITGLKTHEIEDVKALLSRTKLTGLSMLLSALAVTGAPPFASFIAELVIVAVSLSVPYLTALLLSAILLSFLAVNYHVTRMCFGGKGESVSLSALSELVPALACLTSLAISLVVWIALAGGVLP